MSQAPAYASVPVPAEGVSSPGRMLAPHLRSHFETLTGRELGGVRIHDSGLASDATEFLGARAATVGSGIAFARGEFAPHTPTGMRLLAHEIVHVAQQTPGRATSQNSISAQAEREAERLAEPLAAGRRVMISETTGVAPAYALEDYLDRSVSQAEIDSMSMSQLQDDIAEIDEYLDRQNETTVESELLRDVRNQLDARLRQLLQTAGQDPPPPRRRRRRRGRRAAPAEPAATTESDSSMPRILRERTSVPTDDPSEVREEIDRIVAWLQRDDVPAADRQILRDELTILAPQREDARRQESAERQQRRIQRIFNTSGSDEDKLRHSVRAVENIYTDPAEPRAAFIMHEGERHRIGIEQAQELERETLRELQKASRSATVQARRAMESYRTQGEFNADQWAASTVADWLSDVEDPWLAVTVANAQVEGAVAAMQAALARGDLSAAIDPMLKAATSAQMMERAVKAWIDGLIEGASLGIGILTFIRDASFAISTAILAVVAAPVVAGVAAGAGATGTLGTLATIGGTGLVVGGTAGTVGYTSEYAGQLAAGASHEQASREAEIQGQRRFAEGFAAGSGGAATRIIGQAVGVGGQGGYQLVRRLSTEAAGDFIGTTSGELIRGRDPLEALGTGAESAALGSLGTIGGARFRGRPGLQTGVEFGINAGVTTAHTFAEGGSTSDVLQNLVVSGATTGSLHRGRGFQEQQRRRFEAGQQIGTDARSAVRGGVERTRQTALATGFGLAEANPAMLPGFGGTSVSGLGRSSPVSQQAEITRPATQQRTASPAETQSAADVARASSSDRTRALELDLSPPGQRPVAEPLDPSLRTLQPDQGPALQLDTSPNRSATLGVQDHNVIDLDPASAQPQSRFGTPSQETVGTFNRTGVHFHEFNAAELSQAQLRVDYDPVAGRPRSVSYRMTSEAAQSTQSTTRSFTPDPSTEGAQSLTGEYTHTGQNRGHLAPREAFSLGERFVDPAFRGTHAGLQRQVERSADLMTNVLPMDPHFNQRGAWRQAEQQTARLAQRYGHVDVEVIPHYGDNPSRLPNGQPIPAGFIRVERAPNGRILRRRYYRNGS